MAIMSGVMASSTHATNSSSQAVHKGATMNTDSTTNSNSQPEATRAEVAAEQPKDWFFTFGTGHLYPNGYVVFHGTYASAREQMFEIFGPRWAFQYNSAEAAGVERFNLKLVEDL
jgi:hypothetical protein